MNTTVTIHLAHTLFHIDSDAFALLKNYLNKLEKSFAQTEGKQEILEDIEVRIAELFSQYTILYVFQQQVPLPLPCFNFAQVTATSLTLKLQ